MNFPATNEHNFLEFNIAIFTLIVEHKKTNIGFEFTPVKYWYFFEDFQKEMLRQMVNEKISFLNMNIYWSIIENGKILLGPFMSINYLYINIMTGIIPQDYIFSTGLRFLYYTNNNRFFRNYRTQIFNFEIAYRNIKGESKFYLSINADMCLALNFINLESLFPPSTHTRPPVGFKM